MGGSSSLRWKWGVPCQVLNQASLFTTQWICLTAQVIFPLVSHDDAEE